MVKVKFFHTRYQTLGPELIPVYRQSARRILIKSSRKYAAITYLHVCGHLPSQERHRPSTIPSYIAWWQKHIGVNNLPKVATQLCLGGNWTHDPLISSPTLYHYATSPPVTIISVYCKQCTNYSTSVWYGYTKLSVKSANVSMIELSLQCRLKSDYNVKLIN